MYLLDLKPDKVVSVAFAGSSAVALSNNFNAWLAAHSGLASIISMQYQIDQQPPADLFSERFTLLVFYINHTKTETDGGL